MAPVAGDEVFGWLTPIDFNGATLFSQSKPLKNDRFKFGSEKSCDCKVGLMRYKKTHAEIVIDRSDGDGIYFKNLSVEGKAQVNGKLLKKDELELLKDGDKIKIFSPMFVYNHGSSCPEKSQSALDGDSFNLNADLDMAKSMGKPVFEFWEASEEEESHQGLVADVQMSDLELNFERRSPLKDSTGSKGKGAAVASPYACEASRARALLGSSSDRACYRGVYRGDHDVAILHIKRGGVLDDKTQLEALNTHPNIVRCFGMARCPDSSIHLIMELAPLGPLDAYLEDQRDYLLASEGLRDAVLSAAALQVCSGMAHLASVGIVHKGLALRNVLVAQCNIEQEEPDVRVKISDCGLTRDQINGGRGPAILRWMSPEVLKKRRFSEMSDVWSYGVCLWEMLDLADHMPYWEVQSDSEVLLGVCSGALELEQPPGSDDGLWRIAKERCLQISHIRRSTFAELLSMIPVPKILHVATTGDGGDGGDGVVGENFEPHQADGGEHHAETLTADDVDNLERPPGEMQLGPLTLTDAPSGGLLVDGCEHAMGCDPSGCDPSEEVKADDQVHQHQHQECSVVASSSSLLTHAGGKDEDGAHKVGGPVGFLTDVDGAIGVLGLGLKIGLQIDRHDVMSGAKGDGATAGAERDDHAAGEETGCDPAVVSGVIDNCGDICGDGGVGENDDHVLCAAEEMVWSVEVASSKKQGEDVGGGEDLPCGCSVIAPRAHPCRNPSDGGQTSDGHTSDTTVQTVLSGASVQTVLTEEDSVPAGLWLSAADCDMEGSETMLTTIVADNRHAKHPGREKKKGQGSVQGKEEGPKDGEGTAPEKIQKFGSVHVVEAAQYLRAKQAEIKLQVDSFNLAISRGLIERHTEERSASDEREDTPLILAVRDGRADDALVLMAACADPLSRNKLGGTALHVAAQQGSDDAVIEALVERGGYGLASARISNGWTPLHAAAFAGHARVVESVLASVAGRRGRPDRRVELMGLKAEDGRTARDLAVKKRNNGVVAALDAASEAASNAASPDAYVRHPGGAATPGSCNAAANLPQDFYDSGLGSAVELGCTVSTPSAKRNEAPPLLAGVGASTPTALSTIQVPAGESGGGGGGGGGGGEQSMLSVECDSPDLAQDDFGDCTEPERSPVSSNLSASPDNPFKGLMEEWERSQIGSPESPVEVGRLTP